MVTGRARCVATFALVSAALLLPFLAVDEVQGGDLWSHLYAAWLAGQVKHGSVPGLELRMQPTNVLVDLVLEGLLPVFGPTTAGRIVAGATVLGVFWGAVCFLRQLAGWRVPAGWPLLAVLAYGSVFHLGFSNFLVGLALTLFALALGWSGGWARTLGAGALLVVALTAHVLPPLWGAALLGWHRLLRRAPVRAQVAVLAAGVLAAVVVRLLVAPDSQWVTLPRLWKVSGLNQVAPFFGRDYFPIACAMGVLWGVALVRRVRRLGVRSALNDPLLQTLVLCQVGVLLLPERLPGPVSPVTYSFIDFRMSLFVALLHAGVVGAELAPLSLAWAPAALAGWYFVTLAPDLGHLNRAVQQAEAVVRAHAPGTRWVGAVCTGPGRLRVHPLLHLLDRACIGHCLHWAHYEPGTHTFRVRATRPNPWVMESHADAMALETGQYVVPEGSPELWALVPCAAGAGDGALLCAERVATGEPLRQRCVDLDAF